MSRELICTWLGLPPEQGWPPDHYRLLGLRPGEGDTELIQQRVYQCLDSVRAYQITHPEEATEAMNRLAQAFVCLTEPAAKQVYDTSLLGHAAPAPAQPRPLPRRGNGPVASTVEEPLDLLAWLYSLASRRPGPRRRAPERPEPAPRPRQSSVWPLVLTVPGAALQASLLVGLAVYVGRNLPGAKNSSTAAVVSVQPGAVPKSPLLAEPRQPAAPATPVKPKEFGRVLAELKTAGPSRRAELARRLAMTPPIGNQSQRAQVAHALEGLLGGQQREPRLAACQALRQWGNRDSVPALIGMLSDRDDSVRAAAIAALARLKDERAIKPLAARLKDVWDRQRGNVAGALEEFGPKAEDAVIPMLNSDHFTRVEACKVLKAIATQKSIPALEEAAADRDLFVQRAAKDALQVVRARRPGRGPSLPQAEATPATVELLPLGGVTVQAGQTRTVGVRLRRRNCPGPVHLRLENLPEGVEAQPVLVPPGADAGRLELDVTDRAEWMTRQVRVVAQAPGIRAEGAFQVTVGPPRTPAEWASEHTRAIEQAPNDPGNYCNRARAYLDQKKYDATIADCDRAIQLDPKCVRIYSIRAFAYSGKQEYGRAIEDYDKAIELAPRSALAYYTRGVAYLSKREYDRAIVDYDRAIGLDPRYAGAYNARGWACWLKGDIDSAIACYTQAIRLNPRFIQAYANRSLAYLKKGNTARAEVDSMMVRSLRR